MKRLIKYSFMFLLFAIPNIINAEDAECTNSELHRYKSIASNITYKYDYVETFNDKYSDVTFNITVNNLTSDFILKYAGDIYDGFEESINVDINNGVAIYKGALPGTSHRFVVYTSNNTRCPGEQLYGFNVLVPTFNKFYSDERCNAHPEFKYCSKWNSKIVSLETFENEYSNYLKSLEVSEEQTEEIEKEDPYELFYKILDFLYKYVYYVTIPLIVICIIGIIYLKNKDNYDLKVK